MYPVRFLTTPITYYCLSAHMPTQQIDDDSDGELFVDEAHRGSASQDNPNGDGAFSTTAPSVYRAPVSVLQPQRSPIVASNAGGSFASGPNNNGEAAAESTSRTADGNSARSAGRAAGDVGPLATAPTPGGVDATYGRGDPDMDTVRPGEVAGGAEKVPGGVTAGTGLHGHGAHPGYRMSIPRDPSALTDVSYGSLFGAGVYC